MFLNLLVSKTYDEMIKKNISKTLVQHFSDNQEAEKQKMCHISWMCFEKIMSHFTFSIFATFP